MEQVAAPARALRPRLVSAFFPSALGAALGHPEVIELVTKGKMDEVEAFLQQALASRAHISSGQAFVRCQSGVDV